MKILITDPLHEDGVKLMERIGEVDVAHKLNAEQLLGRIGGYDALVVRGATKVTKEVIEAGNQLRVIARAGVGLDNIDVEYAHRRGDHRYKSPVDAS